MTMELRFRHFGASDEDGVFTVGLTDSPEAPTRYLLFSIVAGENAYVERDDQSQGSYGGVESVALEPNRLRLRLSDAAAQALRTDPDVVIELQLREDDHEGLRKGLRRLFPKLVPG